MKKILQLNDAWAVYEHNGDLVILPTMEPRCPMIWNGEQCNARLLLHDFRCYHHPAINHTHCDVHLKCPRCGYYHTYGLPIPHELLKQLQSSRYHGRTLMIEVEEIHGENTPREVIERLRRWGYW